MHNWHYLHSLFSDIFDSVVLDKCCLTGYIKAMLSKSIFHFNGTSLNMSFESFSNPLANFPPVGSFARLAIFVIPNLKNSQNLWQIVCQICRALMRGPLYNNLLHQQRIASWANYRQIRHFRPVRHFRQIRHFPRGHFWHPT